MMNSEEVMEYVFGAVVLWVHMANIHQHCSIVKKSTLGMHFIIKQENIL